MDKLITSNSLVHTYKDKEYGLNKHTACCNPNKSRWSFCYNVIMVITRMAYWDRTFIHIYKCMCHKICFTCCIYIYIYIYIYMLYGNHINFRPIHSLSYGNLKVIFKATFWHLSFFKFHLDVLQYLYTKFVRC